MPEGTSGGVACRWAGSRLHRRNGTRTVCVVGRVAVDLAGVGECGSEWGRAAGMAQPCARQAKWAETPIVVNEAGA